MIFRTLLRRLLIIGFLGLVGYSLARSIYYKSALGVVLALVSIVATVYFIQLLAKARQEAENEIEGINELVSRRKYSHDFFFQLYP